MASGIGAGAGAVSDVAGAAVQVLLACASWQVECVLALVLRATSLIGGVGAAVMGIVAGEIGAGAGGVSDVAVAAVLVLPAWAWWQVRSVLAVVLRAMLLVLRCQCCIVPGTSGA